MKFLFILLLLPISSFSLTIEEKVKELYDISTEKFNLISHANDIKEYCHYLEKYNHFSKEKKIKKIFSDTKKRYLTQYSLGSFFPDLYSNNTYNCVTGSALFAIIFDELSIPYEVVSIPRHVYLIVYPDDESITVDATLDINDSFYFWSDHSTSVALNFLLASGQVSETQINILGADVVLDKYFHTDSKFGFMGLVGFQYFNKALYYYELGLLKKAYSFINKSLGVNFNQEGLLVKSIVLEGLIYNSTVKDVQQVNFLTQFYEITTSGPKRESIILRYRHHNL
jgi:hypothetical protein